MLYSFPDTSYAFRKQLPAGDQACFPFPKTVNTKKTDNTPLCFLSFLALLRKLADLRGLTNLFGL